MRPHIRLAIIAVAIVTGCSGAAAPTSGPTTAPTTAPALAPAAVSIKAGAPGDDSSTALLRFSPATIEIKSGDVVQVVENGDTLHDLTIDVGGKVPTTPEDQHIAVQIPVDLVNKTNQAAINLPPGTYTFYCSIDLGTHGHAIEGMVGTITVH